MDNQNYTKPVVVIVYDMFGRQGGHSGCYKAILKNMPGCWGAGRTAAEALACCVRTAKSFKIDDLHTDNPADYAVEVDIDTLPANKDIVSL